MIIYTIKDISGAVAGDFELAARGVSHFHFLSFVLFLLGLPLFSLVYSLSKTQKIGSLVSSLLFALLVYFVDRKSVV